MAFVDTAGAVHSMTPALIRLTSVMTRKLLAVEDLLNPLSERIRRIAYEYQHRTSFASLAFLSTPEESGRAHLTPLLRDYVSYLTAQWRFLVSDCEIETMVGNAIGQNLRHTFKTAEFLSIGHLLDICRLHRDDLESISLPRIDPADIRETCQDKAKVKQALHDLRSEIITVNGHVVPPAKTTGELASLLAEAINSRAMNLHVGYGGGGGGGQRRGRGGGRKKGARSKRRGGAGVQARAGEGRRSPRRRPSTPRQRPRGRDRTSTRAGAGRRRALP